MKNEFPLKWQASEFAFIHSFSRCRNDWYAALSVVPGLRDEAALDDDGRILLMLVRPLWIRVSAMTQNSIAASLTKPNRS